MLSAVIVASLLVCALGVPTLNDSDEVLDGRIVGGSKISITQAPYQVSILVYNNHGCGGSIIDTNTILTAAHCLDAGLPASAYSIRAGSADRTSGGQVIKVKSYKKHPQYNKNNFNNDFGVMKLSTPLKYQSGVQAISMVAANAPANEGAAVFVSGWGKLKENNPNLPRELHGVTVNVMANSKCTFMDWYNAKTMFCAGVPEGGKDACQMDSGGPAVIGKKLAGVVSFGNGCARKGAPGVYSRIASARSWINSQLN